MGSKSLLLVALAGAAAGVVMSLQTRSGLIRFGGKSLIPLILLLSIIKESGPTIGGLNAGTVKVIKLSTTPYGKVIVVMELAESTRNVIKKDSVGAIRTVRLVGAKFVEILFESKGPFR